MVRLVIDTNVLVSALLKPGSVPDRALGAVWSSAHVVYDARIAAEYRAVLERPKFRAIDRRHVEALLDRVRERGELLDHVPAWEGSLGDDGDRAFIEVALAGRADAIITGNIRHYPSGLGFDVLPPATLLARLESAR